MSSSRRDRSYSPREERSDHRDRDRDRSRVDDHRAHGEGSHRPRHRSDDDDRRADRHRSDSRREEPRGDPDYDGRRARERRDRRGDSPEGSRVREARDRDDRDQRRDRRDREDRRRDDSGRSGRRKNHGSAGEDDEDLLDLRAMGIAEITSDDFFIKSAEFKYWLRKERDRYLDEMSSESARRYFRKFVRRWNDGALQKQYYSPAASSSNTAYKWSFKGEKPSRSGGTPRRGSASPQRHRSDSRDLHREADTPHDASRSRQHDSPQSQAAPVDHDSDSDSDIVGPTLPTAASSNTIAGPTVPTPSERRLAIEDQREAERQARKSKYRSDRRDAYEKADELVPKQVGKEGKMAEKRASNAANKEMRDKEPGGLEVDEGTLMGSEGSSFQAALRARDAAQDRRADRRAMDLADQRAAMEERMAERRQKEAANMEMLRAMAKQRFG